MHRKTLLTGVGGVATAVALSLAAPASAMPVDDPQHPSTEPRATGGPVCKTLVVGTTSDRRVAVYTTRNDKVRTARVSERALGFDTTAAGDFNSRIGRHGLVLDMTAVTSDGVPRRVRAKLPDDGSDAVKLSANEFKQSGFTPRLFAEGKIAYAYAVDDDGTLSRYFVDASRKHRYKLTDPEKVGGGYDDLTSLQAGFPFRVERRLVEMLYATTTTGSLVQIAVPLNHPGAERVQTLRDHGYAGVTELSWSFCNNKINYTSLIGIDPAADTATWTTIKDTTDRTAHARLRGDVGGKNVSWDFTAAY